MVTGLTCVCSYLLFWLSPPVLPVCVCVQQWVHIAGGLACGHVGMSGTQWCRITCSHEFMLSGVQSGVQGNNS